MAIFDWIYPKKCVNCGQGGRYICQRCRRMIQRKGESLAYDGVVRKIIKEIKYRGTYDMVAELVSIWDPPRPDGDWLITSVPMWEGKKRKRGYNQAELIARVIADKWDLNYAQLLRRCRDTMPMYGLTKTARMQNVRGAFEVNLHEIKLEELHRIILIDDVWTSGATLTECQRVLKQIGCPVVVSMALAG